MRLLASWLGAILLCGFPVVQLAAEDCPARPNSGVVNDPYSISSQNGVLKAQFILAHSVDQGGYTHYCYKYHASGQIVEAPTLRLNPGDRLELDLLNRIEDNDAMKMKMVMPNASGQTCGDGGDATLDSTNLHFHGLNVPPVCHQDDVINTLIQPGSPGFHFSIQIPTTEPPGLYWYHPHIHGFTEFQVNGGAAGASSSRGWKSIGPRSRDLPSASS